ncbi:hypothetical protein CEXT_201 [Caerostris extrusa]|uniref:Uncharacterized protein n=1 Tax=Caerostris extrusa TaxID=172846 RepID=A0AAV4WTJ7_CAEEX|nr:hypothetical protein CEXT_201 [Caerostris extrusa]
MTFVIPPPFIKPEWHYIKIGRFITIERIMAHWTDFNEYIIPKSPMQEEAIHFVSHNVMRSYLDAIPDARCHCREMADEHSESVAASILKPISATCPFRCLQSVDRSALCWIVMRRVKTVFILQEMIFSNELVVVLISTVKRVTKLSTLNKKDVYQYI